MEKILSQFIRMSSKSNIIITQRTNESLRFSPNDGIRINLLAVEHCTNSCKYCSTSSPYSKKNAYTASSFFKWLDLFEQNNIQMLLAITGGEPFLHPDISSFINGLKNRYPKAKIGLTTNFFWANENNINIFAKKLIALDTMEISIYPNCIEKMRGIDNVIHLIEKLGQALPQLNLSFSIVKEFIAWELHSEIEDVKGSPCWTSDCFVLRPDGRISHCSIGIGVVNRIDYANILSKLKENLYDLNNGLDGFFTWINKYPFDLCFHCTFWHHKKVSYE
jgi:hypothetical protein